MRDKKLSEREEKIRQELDHPEKPNGLSGELILTYKLYCSLLEHVVRLDKEIDLLKGGK